MTRIQAALAAALFGLAGCREEKPSAPPPRAAAPAEAPRAEAPAPTPAAEPAPAAPERKPCLADSGCPEPPPLPKCGAEVAARPLEDVLRERNQLGDQTVAVKGPLRSSSGCTEMACPADHRCCNHCSGRLYVGPEEPGEGYTSLPLYNDANPKAFECVGDDTRVCCGHPADGREVVARGKLLNRDGDFLLADVELCAP